MRTIWGFRVVSAVVVVLAVVIIVMSARALYIAADDLSKANYVALISYDVDIPSVQYLSASPFCIAKGISGSQTQGCLGQAASGIPQRCITARCVLDDNPIDVDAMEEIQRLMCDGLSPQCGGEGGGGGGGGGGSTGGDSPHICTNFEWYVRPFCYIGSLIWG